MPRNNIIEQKALLEGLDSFYWINIVPLTSCNVYMTYFMQGAHSVF